MKPLDAIETLVLENLRDPVPGECPDSVILQELKEHGYVLRCGDRWLLTPYGEAELAQRPKGRLADTFARTRRRTEV